jgi:glycosyltransferase involved in cell wall biosynthesis
MGPSEPRRGARTARRPAILFVEPSPYRSYGGSKRVLVHLAGALDPERWTARALFYRDGPWVVDLAGRGVDVRVAGELAPAATGGAGTPEDDAGRVPRAGVRRSAAGEPEPTWPRRLIRETRYLVRRHWIDARAARRLEPFVREGVDLVHFNGSMHAEYSWHHAARRHGVPYLLHEHGVWKTPPAAWRGVALAAAAVLCLTRERMERVRTCCGDAVRVEHLPNGIPPAAFGPYRPRDQVRSELGIGAEEALLITAGHLQAWKGQDLAVEAAHRLAGAGTRFVWLLCGAAVEPEFTARLREQIRQRGLGDRVRLLGERADLTDLLAAADVAVHTSVRPEPFGLVVVEAMAAGTGVVGPAEGALPEILRDGVEGRLVPPRDADALARVLAGLLRDPAALRTMGEAARERARAEFGIERQVRALEAIYARVLGRV